MKPLLLEIEGFGPYKGKEIIDFSGLSKSGIFLIKGPTGSGKTTIFDAMTFALYGGGSGDSEKIKNGRNDLSEWRCNQADVDTPTAVTFTFEVNGKKYRFMRKAILARKNLHEENAAVMIDEDGTEHFLLENPKSKDMTEKAIEILSLSKEQFRQVILLPQGQFERFLVANSNDKEIILSKIFDTSKWSSYANQFYEKCANRLDDLREKKKGIDGLINECCEVSDGADVTFDGPNGSISSSQDIQKITEAFEDILQKLEKDFIEFDAEKKQERLNQDRTLFEKHENIRKEKEKRANEVERLNGLTESLINKKRVCEEAVKKDDSKREMAKLSEKKGILTGKITLYENIDKKIKEYEGAKEKYKKDLKDAEIAENAEKASIEKAFEAKRKWDDAEALARELRDKYYANIYGDIASKLIEDEPCPVCGSKEHPSKAKISDDSVSESSMKAAQKDSDKAKKAWEALESDRQKIAAEKVSADSKKNESFNTLKIAESEMNSSKINLIEGIDDLSELNREINNIDKSINELLQAAEELNNNLKSADNALTKHNTELSRAKEELNNAISQLDNNIIEVDSSEFASRQAEINEKIGVYNREKTSILGKIDFLKRKLKTIEELEEEYYSNITEAESDYKFAKALRGDTGIGLQRYVLGIMFNQVIGEANHMLSKVHNGRYQLSRSDEKGAGNKRGLELIAHDSRRPDQIGRNVSMLSGGEKFLVSLALSIGMSTVARKSGIKIDALFIDEGFGTLDNNSIQDAIDVLEDVKNNNGMIGIISHVKLLEENITDQLEIIKSDEGSRIVRV